MTAKTPKIHSYGQPFLLSFRSMDKPLKCHRCQSYVAQREFAEHFGGCKKRKVCEQAPRSPVMSMTKEKRVIVRPKPTKNLKEEEETLDIGAALQAIAYYDTVEDRHNIELLLNRLKTEVPMMKLMMDPAWEHTTEAVQAIVTKKFFNSL